MFIHFYNLILRSICVHSHIYTLPAVVETRYFKCFWMPLFDILAMDIIVLKCCLDTHDVKHFSVNGFLFYHNFSRSIVVFKIFIIKPLFR